MTDYSTVPQEVNLEFYAGDTQPIHITISDALIGGRVFSAQVRSDKNATRIDAEFSVVLIAGVGADLVLSSEDGLALTRRGDYNGFWDVQLAPVGGGDPTTTLAQGTLRLFSDVTRGPA